MLFPLILYRGLPANLFPCPSSGFPDKSSDWVDEDHFAVGASSNTILTQSGRVRISDCHAVIARAKEKIIRLSRCDRACDGKSMH